MYNVAHLLTYIHHGVFCTAVHKSEELVNEGKHDFGTKSTNLELLKLVLVVKDQCHKLLFGNKLYYFQ